MSSMSCKPQRGGISRIRPPSWSRTCSFKPGAASPASRIFRSSERLPVLLWPGRLDLEQVEDALLGVGEAVEADAGGGVGEGEALEGAEDVAAGGFGGAAFGQQPGELLVVAEGVAELGLDQAEDQQRDRDDAGQGHDAVVVVQEDRADLERVLVVAVAALDELLVLVEAQHARGAEASGEVGRERVDAVGARGGGDRVVV